MLCRTVYSARIGTAAVDGIGRNGNVIRVRRLPFSVAETVSLQ